MAKHHFIDDVVGPRQFLIQHHANNASEKVRNEHEHDAQLAREFEKHHDTQYDHAELDKTTPVEEGVQLIQ